MIKKATEDFQFSVAFLLLRLFQKPAAEQELAIARNLKIFNQQRCRPITSTERQICPQ